MIKKAFPIKYLSILALFIICLAFLYPFENKHNVEIIKLAITHNNVFELKKGDLLVRPNNNWLKGSLYVPYGKKFGHVAIVVKGFASTNLNEVLDSTIVIEAILYDQQTRSFIFNKEKQVRKVPASVSFGKKYTTNRYRLRFKLTEIENDSICLFLESQLNAGYSIISSKEKGKTNRAYWNCATLAWKAFNLFGIDIDSNYGWVIYPNDIIGCDESVILKDRF